MARNLDKALPYPQAGNVAFFQTLMDQTDEYIGVDSTSDKTIGLWHILAMAHDYCSDQGIDFDATLAEVREQLDLERG